MGGQKCCAGSPTTFSIGTTRAPELLVAALADEGEILARLWLQASRAEATDSPTRKAREAMSRASHLAGKAINITKTTAPHALSYALTSRHRVPHGMAVAITLAPMLAFNAEVTDEDCIDPRGAVAVRNRIGRILNVLGTNNVEDASASITSLLSQIDCPTTFDAVGVKTSDELKIIVDSVNVERLSNNPRRASQNQLFRLLQTIQRNAATN